MKSQSYRVTVEVPTVKTLSPELEKELPEYIARAANAYPRLVALAHKMFARLPDKADREEVAALLLSIGEIE